MEVAVFLRGLEEILELDAGRLTGDETLSELGEWNSLAVISFIAMVDEKTGKTLNASSIQSCRTVRDLMDLLGKA
jgi:acyl carrier protein